MQKSSKTWSRNSSSKTLLGVIQPGMINQILNKNSSQISKFEEIKKGARKASRREVRVLEPISALLQTLDLGRQSYHRVRSLSTKVNYLWYPKSLQVLRRISCQMEDSQSEIPTTTWIRCPS